MSVSPYQALIAAPVPRPKQLVASYVEHNTTSHKKLVWGFVAFAVVLWLLAGSLDASGGHSSSVLMSYLKALGIMGPLAMLVLGPVLLFWSVNKSGLTNSLRDGQMLPARERSRDVVDIRGSKLVKIVTEFNDGVGGVRQARFEMTLPQAPPAGTQFAVLRRSGTAVVVLWPDSGAVMARVL